MDGCIIAILLILGAIAVSYFVISFFVWLVCVAFGFTFSWLLALGVWAIICLVGFATKSN